MFEGIGVTEGCAGATRLGEGRGHSDE
jgi:hypothetical protein